MTKTTKRLSIATATACLLAASMTGALGQEHSRKRLLTLTIRRTRLLLALQRPRVSRRRKGTAWLPRTAEACKA